MVNSLLNVLIKKHFWVSMLHFYKDKIKECSLLNLQILYFFSKLCSEDITTRWVFKPETDQENDRPLRLFSFFVVNKLKHKTATVRKQGGTDRKLIL